MPELPEVETIRRQLQAHIVGKTVREVKVLYPKVVHGGSVETFVRALKERRVREIGRQGKLILIRLDGNETLVVHLKMTGRLLLVRTPHPNPLPQGEREIQKNPPPLVGGARGGGIAKSTEVIFTFTDGTVLRYDDMRRFGYMKVVPTSEEARVVQKEQLGIDFFDRALTTEKFKTLIRSRGSSQIKPLLMDQSLISGIGNIYAQEACFEARAHPARKANDLSDKELDAFYRALRQTMNRAIALRGASAENYVDAFGKQGGFVPHLKVYGREGKPCLRCKTKLLKKSVGGRGTVFCSQCQCIDAYP